MDTHRPGLARRLAANTLHASSGRVASLVVWILLTPPILHALGPQGFAVWSLFFAVTGYLGDSAGGLHLLLSEQGADAEAAEHLKRAHLRHRPALAVGRTAARLGVRAAIDVSDGLLQDLGHVCRASGLGAEVRAAGVPMSPSLVRAFPGQALALACGGGEDYQLLLIASGHTIQQVQRASKGPVSIIGEMVADPEHRVRLLDATGKELSLPTAGWDHLREAPWRK